MNGMNERTRKRVARAFRKLDGFIAEYNRAINDIEDEGLKQYIGSLLKNILTSVQ